jgi:hypothetical protein
MISGMVGISSHYGLFLCLGRMIENNGILGFTKDPKISP